VYGQGDSIRQLITALFVARNEIELQVKWHLIPSHPISWPQFYFIFQRSFSLGGCALPNPESVQQESDFGPRSFPPDFAGNFQTTPSQTNGKGKQRRKLTLDFVRKIRTSLSLTSRTYSWPPPISPVVEAYGARVARWLHNPSCCSLKRRGFTVTHL
jgi:hypothetical protein